MFNNKQKILLIAPPLLLVTTYFVFNFLAGVLGSINGYLGGFLFYWIIWCGLLPLFLLGPNGIRNLFKDAHPRFGKPAWLGLLFLIGPAITPFFTLFLPRVMNITSTILFISILFAITNGTFEEILWRGTFVSIFPSKWLWSYWYPAIWFGYWHLSPQVVFPSEMPGGPIAFATISIFMGLVFGWVVKKTGSIRYVTIAHIFTDLMGLAGLAFVGLGY